MNALFDFLFIKSDSEFRRWSYFLRFIEYVCDVRIVPVQFLPLL